MLFACTCVMNVRKSNVPNVCRMLSTTSWWHEQACSLTTKYQVCQFEPNKGISGQFERILLQQILFLLLWIGGRQYVKLRLCTIVELICLQVRNICPHISLHDLPYHRTKMKCLLRFFWIRQFFHSSSWHPGFKQISVLVHNILADLTLSLSATQIYMVKKWCLVLPVNVFHENFPSRFYVFYLACQFDIVHIDG